MTEVTSTNQKIDTSQPTPLKGLVLRGHHPVETVQCDGLPEGRPCVVNVEDYDKKLHGPKSEAEKLPTRAKKKAPKKKASADDE